MKRFFYWSTAAAALVIATPALAQGVVEEARANAEEAVADAEKLALAEAALDLYWPEGNAQKAVDYMLGPWADRMLDSPIRELAEPFQPVMAMFLSEMGGMMSELEALDGMSAEDEGTEEDVTEIVLEEDAVTEDEMIADAEAGMDFIMALYGDMTMREIIAGEDEHFDERLTILREVMAEQLPGLLVEFEEPMRASLTKIFAKRFTSAELAAIAAFADTPAGEAFAANMFTIGFEPEYFAGALAGIPGLIEKAPAMVKTLEERMAHLPPMGGLPDDEWTSDCEGIEDEAEKAACEAEAEVEAAADAMEDDWEDYRMSSAELDQWAADLEAEAADLRRQAEERRAEEAAEATDAPVE